jgi:segregation and condensation protein B
MGINDLAELPEVSELDLVDEESELFVEKTVEESENT